MKFLIQSFANCNVKNKLRKQHVLLLWIQFGELKIERGLRFVPSSWMGVVKERSSGDDYRYIAVVKLINSRNSMQTKINELKSSGKKCNPIYRSNRSTPYHIRKEELSSMESKTKMSAAGNTGTCDWENPWTAVARACARLHAEAATPASRRHIIGNATKT